MQFLGVRIEVTNKVRVSGAFGHPLGTPLVCVCVFAHVCVCIYDVCACVCVRAHVCVFMKCVCVYEVCVRVCVYEVSVCVCTFMRVLVWCVCACIFMCIYIVSIGIFELSQLRSLILKFTRVTFDRHF